MRVVVDADMLSYSCGFAAQRTLYDYVLVIDGEVGGEGIAESQAELRDIEGTTGGTVHSVPLVEAEPLEHCLFMVKRTLLRLEADLDKAGLDYDRLELFLTGKGNFREQIATIKGYKANRIGIPKPVHYKAIRRYLRARWHAITVVGYEADDEVAMAAAENEYDPERVLIVSADKDLRTVPGRLYNWQKREFYTITELEARVNFYRQILVGDPADNIHGCHKVGPATAEKLVTEDLTEDQMKAACLAAFETSLAKPGCPYSTMTALEAFTETGRLVHMCRDIRETCQIGWWTP